MNLTLSIILVTCVVIITLIDICLALIVGLILLRVKYVLEQVEKFTTTINQFGSGWAKILSGILTFLVEYKSKKRTKKQQEDEE